LLRDIRNIHIGLLAWWKYDLKTELLKIYLHTCVLHSKIDRADSIIMICANGSLILIENLD